MFSYEVTFDRPGYLLLLLTIPILWRVGRRSLSMFTGPRRVAALAMRTAVVGAFVLALADAQWQRSSDRVTVAYLLDQSLSVPAASRHGMLQFVQASLDQSGDRRAGDRFAVMAFGRDAAIEIPPIDAALPAPTRLETLVEPEFTDVGGAVRRALSLFPDDAARRIVLVTDGNENLGSAYREAQAAAGAGVGIDVAPIFLAPQSDVLVEKVDAPAAARRGQPFDVRIVVRREAAATSQAEPLSGSLRVVRRAGQTEETIAEERIVAAPGKQVLSVRQNLDRADFYAYEARFVADDPHGDAIPENNVAHAFVGVRGRGAVLVIENAEPAGEAEFLVERLRAQDIEADLIDTAQLFESLADLQRYDSVVLVGASRAAADEFGGGADFSDEQIAMLVRNTRELGCGLVMIGGPESFGAGGWAGSELEQAMPVDFQVNAAKVVPSGALSIVLDRSGSMAGEKLAMSKAAAIAAIRSMGRQDFITVTSFDGDTYQTVPLRRVADFNSAARAIDRLGAGGGTDMFPAMQAGFAALRRAEAAVKHMIVLTDGQTPNADFGGLVRQMRAQKITVTAVAVGADANMPLLQQIAVRGAGKFYAVRSPRNLPRIFLREVRRVARPLVFEPSPPVTPLVVADHEILAGVTAVPPIAGMVLTSVKDNPLVEVLLRSPQPGVERNATVLAAWHYGAGRAAALTTDAGRRWATQWTAWEGYDKFFSQLVRWSMRPADGGEFTATVDVRDGVARVTFSATDDLDHPAGAAMTAMVVPPDMKSHRVRLEQTAPGRFVGQFDARQAGTYLVTGSPGPGRAPVRTGVSVGYSAEYDARQSNLALLESLARFEPRGGRAGAYLRQGLDAPREGAPSAFRRDLAPATSTQAVWPWLVVTGACLFWGDVFVRRVHIDRQRVAAWLHSLAPVFRRNQPTPNPMTIDRLRARKHELDDRWRRYADLRRGDADRPEMPPAPSPTAPPAASEPAVEEPAPPSPAAESFSARLLRAKQQAWQDRQQRP